MATLVKSVQKYRAEQAKAIESLNAIYTLETIDVKSIRTLSRPVQTPLKEVVQEINKTKDVPFKETFDFGERFQNYVPACVQDEGVQVLSLSKTVEKWLLEHQIRTINDLQKSSLIGLGGGHVEEVHTTLNRYLSGKELQNCYEVDFLSLIKASFGHIERKSLFLLLKPFFLSDWIQLSTLEKADIKKLTLDCKLKLKESAKKEFNLNYIDNYLKKVFCAWINPWVLSRGGIVSEDEVIERLTIKSFNQEEAKGALNLFKELGISFSRYLFQVEPSLYVTSEFDSKLFFDVYVTAKSYFVRSSSQYPLETLIGYIQRELALSWKQASYKFIKTLLFHSSCFELYRDEKGIWCVKFFKG